MVGYLWSIGNCLEGFIVYKELSVEYSLVEYGIAFIVY